MAVAMEGADPGEGQIVGVSGRSEMADFRMAQALKGRATHHDAAAYSRADGQVGADLLIPPGAPERLGPGGSIYVCVKTNRKAEDPGEPPGKVGVAPAGFGGRGDMSPPWRGRVKFNRAKARQPNSRQRPKAFLRQIKPVHASAQGFIRGRRSNARLCKDLAPAIDHPNDKLCPARFYAAIDRGGRGPLHLRLLDPAGPDRPLAVQIDEIAAQGRLTDIGL